jgi:hypothetical protein
MPWLHCSPGDILISSNIGYCMLYAGYCLLACPRVGVWCPPHGMQGQQRIT